MPEFNFRYVGTEHRYNQLDDLLFMAGLLRDTPETSFNVLYDNVTMAHYQKH